jgi:hypothetical protein
MTKTIYQVWRLRPNTDLWFRYTHIPDCATPDDARILLSEHRAGRYRGNQFKAWMKTDKFKIVRVDQTFTDIESV